MIWGQGLGFGVWGMPQHGFEVRAWGLGFRVWSLGHDATWIWGQGLGFGVKGLGFRIWGLGAGWKQHLGFRVWGMLETGFGVQDLGYTEKHSI